MTQIICDNLPLLKYLPEFSIAPENEILLAANSLNAALLTTVGTVKSRHVLRLLFEHGKYEKKYTRTIAAIALRLYHLVRLEEDHLGPCKWVMAQIEDIALEILPSVLSKGGERLRSYAHLFADLFALSIIRRQKYELGIREIHRNLPENHVEALVDEMKYRALYSIWQACPYPATFIRAHPVDRDLAEDMQSSLGQVNTLMGNAIARQTDRQQNGTSNLLALVTVLAVNGCVSALMSKNLQSLPSLRMMLSRAKTSLLGLPLASPVMLVGYLFLPLHHLSHILGDERQLRNVHGGGRKEEERGREDER
ncbi:hypothetical protein DFP72DRAFT_856630 [Ephemerocybe angulata]|uniref:Uncharacterized protein n=1 Tax=Ephemerocybe angulata TaxID=980116 RepID=A0A8H6HE09_9AGAR|nr:hypothetical protein DFP72DRAFT_856630 [Tulosesus angulatus]